MRQPYLVHARVCRKYATTAVQCLSGQLR